jgi:hypothetical protein
MIDKHTPHEPFVKTNNAKTDASFLFLVNPEQNARNLILYRTCVLCHASADSLKYRYLRFRERQEEDIEAVFADARKFYGERMKS